MKDPKCWGLGGGLRNIKYQISLIILINQYQQTTTRVYGTCAVCQCLFLPWWFKCLAQQQLLQCLLGKIAALNVKIVENLKKSTKTKIFPQKPTFGLPLFKINNKFSFKTAQVLKLKTNIKKLVQRNKISGDDWKNDKNFKLQTIKISTFKWK